MAKINKKEISLILIIVLVIFLFIASASNIFKNNSEDYYEKLESTIAIKGKKYFSNNSSNLPLKTGNITKIDIARPDVKKYLTDVKGIDKRECIGNIVVQKLSNGSYSYTTCLKCEKKSDGSYSYLSTSKECSYKEEDNDKETIKIDELGDKEIIKIPQVEPYRIPNARVYVNNQPLLEELKPMPKKIDTNILTTYKIGYTYKNLFKELKIKIYDPKDPVLENITGTVNGKKYVSNTLAKDDVTITLSATDWTEKSIYGSGIDYFEYQVNSGTIQKLPVDTIDNITYTKEILFNGSGTYNISVRAVDKEKNKSDVKTFTIRIRK